jgi:hypothetical protein
LGCRADIAHFLKARLPICILITGTTSLTMIKCEVCARAVFRNHIEVARVFWYVYPVVAIIVGEVIQYQLEKYQKFEHYY